MSPILFVGKTASGLLKVYVGRNDLAGRLCDWFVSGIPTLKLDSYDPIAIEELAITTAIDEFPSRADFERYVRAINPKSWGRYGVAAAKRESPTRVIDVDIDPWSRTLP